MTALGEEVIEAVPEIVAKVRRVPDRARQFEVSATAAVSEFRIVPALLEQLRRFGLPSRRVGGDELFDRYDLLNVALNLDIGSAQRKVLSWWARELDRPYGDFHTYELEYIASCPDPRHPGTCDYRVLRPDRPRLSATRSAPDPSTLHRESFTLPRIWPDLPPAVQELIEGFSRLSYLRLPHPLCWDVEFILASGIGDCAGMSRILVDEGRKRGLAARFSFGKSLTPPFASTHYWAEFMVDGIWVPVDPLLNGAMIGWGLLNASRWTVFSSLGGIMARLARGERDLVLHADARHGSRPVPVHLRATHLTG
ncbi:transglutaminase domain-containing protein [Kitasatospora terrestris]|uniref:Transglutaminase-like domain-containing protein n=1 Tax=Kitasatospora terrestris TaxID=258051 RepID=A0ABP9DEX1_9ACTN